MARARAVGPRESTGEGDSLVETYQVTFFGADMAATDSTYVTITIGPTDTVTQAEDKLVTAMVDAGTALFYAMARTRCVYPAMKRGS